MSNMSGDPLDDAIFWSSATGDHDWTDFEVPRQVLSVAVARGVIGDADWVEPRANAKRRKFEVRAHDLGHRLTELAKGGETWLTVGGSRPHDWTAFIIISDFIHEEGEVAGLNTMRLRVPRKSFRGTDASDRLWTGFREAHDAGNTGYACIHLEERWRQLTISVYDPPLERIPAFKGILWANFLGGRQLARFDRGVLEKLEAFRVEWAGQEGLFIQASPDVAEADNPEVEKELFRLTDEFRRAKLS